MENYIDSTNHWLMNKNVNKLWEAVKDKSIPGWIRLILASTFDNAIIEYEKLPIISQYYKSFVELFSGKSHLLDWSNDCLDIFNSYQKNNCFGICFLATSVNEDSWEDYDLLKSNKHWFLFDKWHSNLGVMKEKYLSWIRLHYPTSESAQVQCSEATLRMLEAFPELKRVRGIVLVKEPLDYTPTKAPHWWLVSEDGTIIDPVVHQFPLGVISYKEWDEIRGKPTGKCMNCGDLCSNNSSVCSEECGNALNE